MSATPLPRSLRLTRHLTRGVLLAATAGTGALGVHLAADQPARHAAVPAPPVSGSGATSRRTATPGAPTPAPSTTAPSAPAAPSPTRSAARPAPRATPAPTPRYTPPAPVAPASGSGTGGGTTHGS